MTWSKSEKVEAERRSRLVRSDSRCVVQQGQHGRQLLDQATDTDEKKCGKKVNVCNILSQSGKMSVRGISLITMWFFYNMIMILLE